MLHVQLWLERNNRVFKNKSNSVMAVVESIIWSVSEWTSTCNVRSLIEFM